MALAADGPLFGAALHSAHGHAHRRHPSVEIARYPALRLRAWQLHQERLSEPEPLARYEREWRHLDPDRLRPDELALIKRRVRTYGQGVLNV
ncbi:hypothetical protein [Thiohalocapsa sp. ML1]|uniref:hypothetical protein n=1 Tax=Thiohalocapsa sp. ML1 TaxID=1431688 RepID=UPI0012E35BCD|nr:hypothetical protein [Thiohalocapsa sp. ML1]